MGVIQNRRLFVKSLGTFTASALIAAPAAAQAQTTAPDALTRTIEDVEKRLGARMGVAIFDTESSNRWQHRADERFPMCSTFKALAAAAVLALVDQGREDLNRRIFLGSSDLVTYSPVTKDRLGGDGMTIGELCEAAITTSDNTAGNMMLRAIGGPEGFTAFVRSMGDTVTRLDRWETDLNEAAPGDVRDTTTPAAMIKTLQALTLGNVLSATSRDHLIQWLVGNKVGDAKIRAGLPKNWRVADKTGGGSFGTNNDIAVIWPPVRKPVLVSIFTTETNASFDDRNAGMAEIARSLVLTLTR